MRERIPRMREIVRMRPARTLREKKMAARMSRRIFVQRTRVGEGGLAKLTRFTRNTLGFNTYSFDEKFFRLVNIIETLKNSHVRVETSDRNLPFDKCLEILEEQSISE